MYAVFDESDGKQRLHVGQMIIATLVNLVLAGLGAIAFSAGVIAVSSTGLAPIVPWSTILIVGAAVIAIAHGVGLTLLAWWDWFGARAEG